MKTIKNVKTKDFKGYTLSIECLKFGVAGDVWKIEVKNPDGEKLGSYASEESYTKAEEEAKEDILRDISDREEDENKEDEGRKAISRFVNEVLINFCGINLVSFAFIYFFPPSFPIDTTFMIGMNAFMSFVIAGLPSPFARPFSTISKKKKKK